MSKSKNKLSLQEQRDRNRLEQVEQLNEMVAIIGGLLDAQGIQCNGDVAEVPKNKRGRPAGSGYFEDKLINGYGPYRYLRFWQNGQRRSVYVGKVIEESIKLECDV